MTVEPVLACLDWGEVGVAALLAFLELYPHVLDDDRGDRVESGEVGDDVELELPAGFGGWRDPVLPLAVLPPRSSARGVAVSTGSSGIPATFQCLPDGLPVSGVRLEVEEGFVGGLDGIALHLGAGVDSDGGGLCDTIFQIEHLDVEEALAPLLDGSALLYELPSPYGPTGH